MADVAPGAAFREDGGADAYRTRPPDTLETMLGPAGFAIAVKVFDDFPGAGGRFAGKRFAMKALSPEDLAMSGAASRAYLVKCGYSREEFFDEDVKRDLNHQLQCEHLARALRQPDHPEHPLMPVESVRRLETTEVHGLYDRLLAYQEERSPFAYVREWGEVEDHIAAVGKGLRPRSSLSKYDNGTLRFIVSVLAEATSGTPTRPPFSDTSSPSDSATPSNVSQG